MSLTRNLTGLLASKILLSIDFSRRYLRYFPQVIRTDAENTTVGERLLEGKNVNLRILEEEDLPQFAEWFNNPEVTGEYNPLRQISKTDAEKILETPNELKPFIIGKKMEVRLVS